MKQALRNWYEAMQANGLAPEGTNDMERFIDEGLRPAEAADGEE